MLDKTLTQYNPTDFGNGKHVGIYDCTLRDGEQAAGVVFTREDKLKIAHVLDELGVDRIEVGMPVVSPEDSAAARDIVAAGLNAECWGFCRHIKGDIDACLDVGLTRTILEIPSSMQKMQAYNLTHQKVLSRITEMVEYACANGMYVAFFVVDATRTEEPFLKQVLATAVSAGASELVLADTLSVATPKTIADLTAKMIYWTGLPLMVHAHNDFGLATACTLAGIQAGASYAHVTINGLGEKAGNTDIAEVAFALSMLMGYKHNIRMELLPYVAAIGESLSLVPLSAQKPVVGKRTFTRESGVVISQINTYPPAVEAYDSRIVGRQTEVVLGKKSGKASVEYMANKLGLPHPSDEEMNVVVTKIKELSLRNKSHIEESDFIKILDSLKA